MLLALATLVLLPGLLVVRAPWTAVPALSLAFWALSAWWPPLASASRGRVTLGALVVFVPLLLLRFLPKHEVPPPPGTPPLSSAPRPASRPGLPPPPLLTSESAFVLVAALALALPGLRWGNAPGPDAAFQTTAARLALWRDANPANLEPLIPLAPFGAHSPALATLAADLARLSGADPAPAVAAVLAAAAGTMLVGLFALHAARTRRRVAALGALVGLAAAPWPLWVSPWGAADAVLALAFLLPALALVAAHASRSSAVAAAFLLAAGALAHPVLALGAAFAAAAVAGRPGGRRAAVVLGGALVFGLPGLWPLAQALSWSEVLGAARALQPADAAWLAAGPVVLVLGRLAGAALERADRRLAAAVALLATALLVARFHGWMAAGQLSAADQAALRRAARQAPPYEPLCAPGGPLRDWVPAIAERPAGEPGPWIPAVYRDEWERRPARPCATVPR